MNEPQYDICSIKDPLLLRLAEEHKRLHALCRRSNVISYEVVAQHALAPNPPRAYRLFYDVRSITGIDENDQPLFGRGFAVKVNLPTGDDERYPYSPAVLYVDMEHRPLWHPNVKYTGNFAGRICGNSKAFGKAFDLGELALRIGEIIQYKNYLAEEIEPYPEDGDVARWVREVAEPAGILNSKEGLGTDDQDLMLPDEHQQPNPPPIPKKPSESGIIIKNPRAVGVKINIRSVKPDSPKS